MEDIRPKEDEMTFKSRDLWVQVTPGERDTPCCPCRSTGEEPPSEPDEGTHLERLRQQLRAALEAGAR